MLTIRNFSKQFSSSPILSIPFAEFSSGVYWIKGENGSGKTTLFKSIAGLIPSEGSIAFNDGISLHQSPIQYRKRVSYSEAEPLYPGFLTSKDLIRFVGKVKKATLEQQHSLVEKFGIHVFFEKPCKTYSSGMMKKLSLALAFLGPSQLIILDEPLITLDERAREILLSLIQARIEKQEAIFLISSHQELNINHIKINETFAIENRTLVQFNPS